jgi:hypothetical protein
MEAKDIANIEARLVALVDELDESEVTPQQVAAFISSMVGGKTPPAFAKVPGYDYAYRIAEASLKTLANQGDAVNDAWSQMKRGAYGVGSAMKTWVTLVEGWYDVVLEASRGPAYRKSPGWVVFDRRDGAETFERDVDVDVQNPGDLETTNFERIGAHDSRAGGYKPAPTARGGKVSVRIDRALVRQFDPGLLFISFIFPKSRGPSEPLVIVVVRT